LGKAGWRLHEYSAGPVKTGVTGENGQPIVALEISLILYREVDEGKITLKIDKNTGVKNALKN
jgi:hypothetical protein